VGAGHLRIRPDRGGIEETVGHVEDQRQRPTDVL
jgi:hypothetical protein